MSEALPGASTHSPADADTSARRRPRRGAALAAALAALVLAPAAPAAAEPQWYGGGQESSLVPLGCTIPGTLVPGMHAKAWVQADPAAPTRVGDVFYAAVSVAVVANTCVEQSAAVDVLPPVGVELAISPQHPVRCFTDDLATGVRTESPAGCPQAPVAGLHGPRLAFGGRADGLWFLPTGKLLSLWFPLRSSRPLAGLPVLSPGCGRPAGGGGEPPCRPEQAGDNLQIAVWALDGFADPYLVPTIGLQVAPGPASAGAPAPAPAPGASPRAGAPRAPRLLTAPRALTLRRALRGVAVTVAVPASGARVVATLSARRLGRIAVARRANVRAGTLRLRLAPTRRAAARLRRARAVTATLRVTVRTAGATRSASARLRIGRAR